MPVGLVFVWIILFSAFGKAGPCEGAYGLVTAQDHFVLTEIASQQKEMSAIARAPKTEEKISGSCFFDANKGSGVIEFSKQKSFFNRQNYKGVIQQDTYGYRITGREPEPWRAYQLVNDKVLRPQDPNQIESLRKTLQRLFWKETGLPLHKMPTGIQKNVKSPLNGLQNLESVDDIQIKVDPGFISHAFLFHPAKPQNRAIIFHQGHDDKSEAAGRFNAIQTFLNQGFDVVVLAMPLYGPNSGPPGFNKEDHRAIINLLIQTPVYPLSVFIEPVIVSINYLESLKKYPWIAMMGLSGGGWTTTVSAALDSRIRFSFPVAGSMPLSWKQNRDWGDPEQFEPSFLQLASFTELYLLGGAGPGRRQVQIHNEFDSCCFATSAVPSFVSQVQEKVSKTGGAYFFVIDRGQKDHTISLQTLQNFVLPVLKENSEF